MPTIPREGPYQFCFVSADRDEPPHVHVRRDNGFAKLWLDPGELRSSGNLGRAEVRRIRSSREHERQLLEARHEYFNP